jgi:hypothetical protein
MDVKSRYISARMLIGRLQRPRFQGPRRVGGVEVKERITRRRIGMA